MNADDTVNRRALLLGGGAVVVGTGLLAYSFSDSGESRSAQGPAATPINEGGAVFSATIVGDISVQISNPYSVIVPMQTNGVVLRIETDGSAGAFDLSKIQIECVDRGHDADGNEADQARKIGVRDFLRGPYNQTTYYSPQVATYYLVLDDRIYRQDEQWQTKIKSIQFEAGWLEGKAGEYVSGDFVSREDSLAYLPFPVKTPTAPFQRLGAGERLLFEVSGSNDFARNGSQFAFVEAWTFLAGVAGPVARTSYFERSPQTPEVGTPSGRPAPTYSLMLDGSGLPDGVGEVRYRVCPWIGPAWSSADSGETYPTPNAPKGLPFLMDSAGSYSPVFGIVSIDGTGAAGTSVLGLAHTMEAAIASGILYKDIAAVAGATRKYNAASMPIQIADGSSCRPVRHDDIAGGVAVLRPVDGSGLGSNIGAYAMRAAFSSIGTFPIGPTLFEIRSESGKPSDSVRIRGVLPTGVAVAAAAKAVTPRLLLRGLTLDGTNSTTTQNIIFDGTAAAGAATTKPSMAACAYLVRIDCRVIENANAGTANAACYRAGLMWDIRTDCQGVSGLNSLCGNSAVFSALVASIGSRYSRSSTGSGLMSPCLLGVTTENVPIKAQSTGIQSTFTGQLLFNVFAGYSVAFTSPIVMLGNNRPVVGGLGLCNVFCFGTVDSGGPLIQIGADGTRREMDNVIVQHVGHYLANSTKQTNGRANLFYQDQGFSRINKVGSIVHSAFNCYAIKGDSFNAPEIVGASTTDGIWVLGKSYYKGTIVWDAPGSPTALSRYYQAKSDIGMAAPEQVALSDATRWQDCGLVNGKAFGAQPLRQGNWAIRCQIACRGNVAAVSYSSETTPSPTSGYGLVWGRDSKTAAKIADYYVEPERGNFVPKSIARGDEIDSPLLNRVVAGFACAPFDIAGQPRRNDGSGAAGAFERA